MSWGMPLRSGNELYSVITDDDNAGDLDLTGDQVHQYLEELAQPCANLLIR